MNMGVIFDSDGVIVDSEHYSLVAFRQAIAEQGISISPEELWQWCGLTDESIIKRLEEKYQRRIDLQQFIKRKFDIYFQLAENGLRAFPGVTELLDMLDEANIPYALASSGPRRKIDFNLKKVGLQERFKAIVSGEDVLQSKPAPYIYLRAAELINRSPAECIAIEDSPNGLLGAKRAGMVTIGLRTTFKDDSLLREADCILDSIDQINLQLLYTLLNSHHKMNTS